MVEKISSLDKIHMQKYIYLLRLYCNQKIESNEFERIFLQIRREDNYLMSGSFNETIERILSSFFLDVDAYVPENLSDQINALNINEYELRKRAFDTLQKLLSLSS